MPSGWNYRLEARNRPCFRGPMSVEVLSIGVAKMAVVVDLTLNRKASSSCRGRRGCYIHTLRQICTYCSRFDALSRNYEAFRVRFDWVIRLGR